MSFYVTYGGDLTASNSLSDFFVSFSAFYAQDGHEYVSSFNSTTAFPGPLSGTEYAITSSLGEIEDFSFIAGAAASSELTYTLFDGAPSNWHILYGSLDSLEFGTSLVDWQNTGTGNFDLGETYLDITGLGLTGLLSDGQSNIVHEVVWGLMGGDATALEGVLNDILDDYGLSVNSSFADLELAGLAGEVSTVGTAVAAESELLLAA